jgi:hypothetical protein
LKTTDTKLISGQQRKINELIGIAEKLNKAVKKYGDELDDYQPNIRDEWKAEIVDLSKFK